MPAQSVFASKTDELKRSALLHPHKKSYMDGEEQIVSVHQFCLQRHFALASMAVSSW